jgi:23S rRNA (cytidine1920-2'-O)/16S rRNA (cytidine1409-2'-O)-methyltransferase
MNNFVSRAGEKLEFAITKFNMDPTGFTCADCGSSTGGFTQCLLSHGALKVYAVEIAYGELDWKLRQDKRVVVMERTNAMHVTLPEKVDLITVDVGWTKQLKILPNTINNLKDGGKVISLIKPHYESPKEFLRGGKLMEEKVDEVVENTKNEIQSLGLNIIDIVPSPILGDKGKNKEFLALIEKSS